MRKNVIFSICSMGTNYLFPVIIIPFLVSKYGLHEYGYLSLMFALSGIVIVFTGLNLDATYASLKVETTRGVIWRVIILRSCFAILGVMLCLIFSIVNGNDILSLLVVMLPVLGNVVNGNCYLIKEQDFKSILLFNFVAKVISIIVISVLVSFDVNIIIIGFFMNSWYLVSSLLSFYKVWSNANNEHEYASKRKLTMFCLFRMIMPGFSSSLASLIMTVLVQPIMSIISSNNYSDIGIYSIFEKLIRAATGIFDSVNGVVYAKLASMNKQKEKNAIIFNVVKVYLSLILVGAFGSFLIFKSFDFSFFFAGVSDSVISKAFVISSLIVLCIVLGNVSSSLILFENRIFTEVSWVITASSSLFLIFLFTPFVNKGVVFVLSCLLVSEFLSMMLKGMLVWKKSPFCK
ncbi:oligosaccharide flippase family protein [Plesiomonas shigelloides]|uniref:oligosaccharide flippase family protein n=1 Tax=Plesiomonas shigelloides TaxID=703 RepID=UPI00351CD291